MNKKTNEMKTKNEAVLPAVFPKDKHGIRVKVGDKVKGFGSIKFQDGFSIDRTPVVTANIQNGRLYFGALSCESFNEFEIIKKDNELYKII
jgi:hypothetical protein